ncbi:MAG: AbrB/MazE/SpoVT family DNA-binding domain-containing protein [Clostridiales bacterium]|nr:AbrB/MazE/SpoVT family DNA-binding domain-containing protein [Clostridiales bacterium]
MQKRISKTGRISIPKSIMQHICVQTNDYIELNLEYGNIVIKKFYPKTVITRPYIGVIKKVKSTNELSIPKEYIDVLNLKEGTNIQLEKAHSKIVIKIIK